MLKIGKQRETDERDNLMFFNTDDDFYGFCINPEPVFNTTDYDKGLSKCITYDYDFTPSYLDAVNNGVVFIIKDPKSNVLKRGCVNHRLVTKPVTNLEPYNPNIDYVNYMDALDN